MYIKNNKRWFYGFTLAETLITIVIVGVVAALTVPTMIAKYHEQQAVSKVKKAYSSVAQAWQRYQNDNSCLGKVSLCFANDDNRGNFYIKFSKYFNHVDKIVYGSATDDISWLPDKAYALDGSLITNYWMGVTQYSGGTFPYFSVADGTIYHIDMPDNYRQSGYVFFDINGKKGPNRIGKDQFTVGIGAYNNQKYADKVHPYYAEDSSDTQGLCAIRDNNECDPDVCVQTSCSPTAYVLKNNKLPPITW